MSDARRDGLQNLATALRFCGRVQALRFESAYMLRHTWMASPHQRLDRVFTASRAAPVVLACLNVGSARRPVWLAVGRRAENWQTFAPWTGTWADPALHEPLPERQALHLPPLPLKRSPCRWREGGAYYRVRG